MCVQARVKQALSDCTPACALVALIVAGVIGVSDAQQAYQQYLGRGANVFDGAKLERDFVKFNDV